MMSIFKLLIIFICYGYYYIDSSNEILSFGIFIWLNLLLTEKV